MNKQDFIRLIKDPSQVSSRDAENLEDLIASFPYCQIAHILVAKISHQDSSMLAKQKLSKAAAYILERPKLKKLVLSNTVENYKAKKEQVIYPSGTVYEEPIVITIPPSLNFIKKEEKQSVTEIKVLSSLEVKEDTAASPSALNVPIPESYIETALPEPAKANRDTEGRSAFFRELEQNLEKLRKLKEKNELKKFVDTPIEPSQIQTENSVLPDEPQTLPIEYNIVEDIAFVEEVSTQIPSSQPETETEPAQIQEVPIVTEIAEVHETVVSPSNGPSTEPALYSSRLEEVLLSDNEVSFQSATRVNDVLYEYILFLANRKKILFRSREKVNNIIARFINDEPTIPYFKNDDLSEIMEDLSEESTKVSNHIASENFAKLLVRQGKYKKAIAVYEELILKNPEKKLYFADQIEAINNKI